MKALSDEQLAVHYALHHENPTKPARFFIPLDRQERLALLREQAKGIWKDCARRLKRGYPFLKSELKRRSPKPATSEAGKKTRGRGTKKLEELWRDSAILVVLTTFRFYENC